MTLSRSTAFGSDDTSAGTPTEFFDELTPDIDDECRAEGGERVFGLEQEQERR